MKKVFCILIAICVCGSCVIFSTNSESQEKQEIFRLHIRANSNLEVDQSIKMEIKEEFVKFLTPYVAECDSKAEVIEMTKNVIEPLENIADNILKKNGFNYLSNVKICSEYFPDRSYGEYIIESGYYDALIVELGEAKGDNWWCVVYPPLCFVDYSNNFAGGVVYKSKILEIINKFFDKGEENETSD